MAIRQALRDQIAASLVQLVTQEDPSKEALSGWTSGLVAMSQSSEELTSYSIKSVQFVASTIINTALCSQISYEAVADVLTSLNSVSASQVAFNSKNRRLTVSLATNQVLQLNKTQLMLQQFGDLVALNLLAGEQSFSAVKSQFRLSVQNFEPTPHSGNTSTVSLSAPRTSNEIRSGAVVSTVALNLTGAATKITTTTMNALQFNSDPPCTSYAPSGECQVEVDVVLQNNSPLDNADKAPSTFYVRCGFDDYSVHQYHCLDGSTINASCNGTVAMLVNRCPNYPTQVTSPRDDDSSTVATSGGGANFVSMLSFMSKSVLSTVMSADSLSVASVESGWKVLSTLGGLAFSVLIFAVMAHRTDGNSKRIKSKDKMHKSLQASSLVPSGSRKTAAAPVESAPRLSGAQVKKYLVKKLGDSASNNAFKRRSGLSVSANTQTRRLSIANLLHLDIALNLPTSLQEDMSMGGARPTKTNTTHRSQRDSTIIGRNVITALLEHQSEDIKQDYSRSAIFQDSDDEDEDEHSGIEEVNQSSGSEESGEEDTLSPLSLRNTGISPHVLLMRRRLFTRDSDSDEHKEGLNEQSAESSDSSSSSDDESNEGEMQMTSADKQAYDWVERKYLPSPSTVTPHPDKDNDNKIDVGPFIELPTAVNSSGVTTAPPNRTSAEQTPFGTPPAAWSTPPVANDVVQSANEMCISSLLKPVTPQSLNSTPSESRSRAMTMDSITSQLASPGSRSVLVSPTGSPRSKNLAASPPLVSLPLKTSDGLYRNLVSPVSPVVRKAVSLDQADSRVANMVRNFVSPVSFNRKSFSVAPQPMSTIPEKTTSSNRPHFTGDASSRGSLFEKSPPNTENNNRFRTVSMDAAINVDKTSPTVKKRTDSKSPSSPGLMDSHPLVQVSLKSIDGLYRNLKRVSPTVATSAKSPTQSSPDMQTRDMHDTLTDSSRKPSFTTTHRKSVNSGAAQTALMNLQGGLD
eukprot:gene31266-38632_t